MAIEYNKEQAQATILLWHKLSPVERAKAGLPKSQSALYDHLKVPAKTYYDWVKVWKKDGTFPKPVEPSENPGFVAPVDYKASENIADLVDVGLTSLGFLVSQNNPSAVSTLFSMPAVKQFLEAQTAKYDRRFDDLDDDALYAEILETIPEEFVLRFLESKGYKL